MQIVHNEAQNAKLGIDSGSCHVLVQKGSRIPSGSGWCPVFSVIISVMSPGPLSTSQGPVLVLVLVVVPSPASHDHMSLLLSLAPAQEPLSPPARHRPDLQQHEGDRPL